MYEIIDTQTNAQVGKPYASRERAQLRADAMDTEHGAVRYQVRRVANN